MYVLHAIDEFKPVSTTQALYIFECTKIQFFDNSRSRSLCRTSHFSGEHTAHFEPNVSYEMDTVQQQNGEKIVIFQIGARKKTHTNVQPTAWYINTRSLCSWIRFLKQRKFIVHDLNYLERKPKHYYYRILYALNKTAYKTKISVIEVVLKYTQIQLIT